MGYSWFIKALENNDTLQVLEMAGAKQQFSRGIYRNNADVREQLVISLPRMKGIRRLKLRCALEGKDQDLVMAAVAANTSNLVEFIVLHYFDDD
jgi:hypothetical protein